MPSPSELTLVVRQLAPRLKAAGWKRFGATFNREPEEGLVHVINFQASRWERNFTVNIGVYVREIDPYFDDWWGRHGKDGESGRDSAVPEDVCWLRQRLGCLSPPSEDLWWRYDDDPEKVVEDIREKLGEHAARAFEEAASRATILSSYGVDNGLPSWPIEADGGLATPFCCRAWAAASTRRPSSKSNCSRQPALPRLV